MDRFQYREREEPKEFSTCANPDCRRQIFVGDEYIDHYGYISCPELKCLIKVTESTLRIAGDEE
jgi:hypothetical protein